MFVILTSAFLIGCSCIANRAVHRCGCCCSANAWTRHYNGSRRPGGRAGDAWISACLFCVCVCVCMNVRAIKGISGKRGKSAVGLSPIAHWLLFNGKRTSLSKMKMISLSFSHLNTWGTWPEAHRPPVSQSSPPSFFLLVPHYLLSLQASHPPPSPVSISGHTLL